MAERYEAVVIGAGPAGETAISRLHGAGLRVAIAERELIGGECGYWACMPSKTLLRPPETRAEAGRAAGVERPALEPAGIFAYRDKIIRHLDDGKQISGYREQGIDVFKAPARLVGPGVVEVDGQRLESERVIVATGTEAKIPPIEGLEEAGYWTNREATTFSEVPDSVVVLGGGPVGIELAQLLRRLGAEVVLVESNDRLLGREHPRASELVAEALAGDGVEVLTGERAVGVSAGNGQKTVRLESGGEVSGAELLVAVGRRPRTADLGLETVGIDPDGGIDVDERLRAAEGVWAVGDVTGVMPFTHAGTYQARIACADILGQEARADYSGIPRVVFSDPEVAAVGLTEEQASERGIELATAEIDLAQRIARPVTYEQNPRGTLAVLADRSRGVLVGAWAVAPLAGEWIHQAALAVKAEIPLAVLRDTVQQFPTFSEGLRGAVEKLDA